MQRMWYWTSQKWFDNLQLRTKLSAHAEKKRSESVWFVRSENAWRNPKVVEIKNNLCASFLLHTKTRIGPYITCLFGEPELVNVCHTTKWLGKPAVFVSSKPHEDYPSESFLSLGIHGRGEKTSMGIWSRPLFNAQALQSDLTIWCGSQLRRREWKLMTESLPGKHALFCLPSVCCKGYCLSSHRSKPKNRNHRCFFLLNPRGLHSSRQKRFHRINCLLWSNISIFSPKLILLWNIIYIYQEFQPTGFSRRKTHKMHKLTKFMQLSVASSYLFNLRLYPGPDDNSTPSAYKCACSWLLNREICVFLTRANIDFGWRTNPRLTFVGVLSKSFLLVA